ncbi:MAG: iron-sulfur cluster co-chaperone HscB C-terminal domain-containing protein [Saprospiraceae bacterium]
MAQQINYFEFFGLPVSINLDEAALKRRFYEYSKKFHPDFYTLESPEKQAEILELSTINNEAWRTLSNFDSRLKYLLELKGQLGEEGTNVLPQEFLMEMMDINEAAMELEFEFDPERYAALLDQLAELERDLQAELTGSLFLGGAEASEFETMKDYHLKKRYLLRIKESLSKFAVPKG